MIRRIIEILSMVYVIFTPIFIYLGQKNNMNYSWIYFASEIFACLIQSVFIYNILDNLYPTIIYDFSDYKVKTRTKILKFFIFLFMLLIVLFTFFVTSLYIMNFEYISGNYYLQLLQPCFFFLITVYFLGDAFSDYSGWSYCDFYQSYNGKEINYHWIPRTLTTEMKETYDNECYSFVD